MKVFIGTPTMRGCSPPYVMALLALLRELDRRGVEHTYSICQIDQIALARDQLAHEFLASGAEVSIWIDDDNVAPPDFFLRALDSGFEFVAAAYRRRWLDEPLTHQWAMKVDPLWWRTPELALDRGTFPAAWVGLGLAVLRREAFERVAPSAPAYVARGEPRARVHGFFQHLIVDGRVGGEDMSFCHRLREAGATIRVLADVTTEHWQAHNCWRGNVARAIDVARKIPPALR